MGFHGLYRVPDSWRGVQDMNTGTRVYCFWKIESSGLSVGKEAAGNLFSMMRLEVGPA